MLYNGTLHYAVYAHTWVCMNVYGQKCLIYACVYVCMNVWHTNVGILVYMQTDMQ